VKYGYAWGDWSFFFLIDKYFIEKEGNPKCQLE
jgi:hypothetical protein